MFNKQYHDYLIYFNQKINTYNDKLAILKKRNTNQSKESNYNKIYNDYNKYTRNNKNERRSSNN